MLRRMADRLALRSADAPLLVGFVVDRGAHAYFGRMHRQLGLALAAAGHRVALATDDPRLLRELDSTPIATIALPGFGGWGVLRSRRLLAGRTDDPPDIVVSSGMASLPAAHAWTRSSGASVVAHLARESDIRIAARRRLARTTSVIVACEPQRERLLSRGAKPARVTCIPPALLAPAGDTSPPAAEPITDSFPFADEPNSPATPEHTLSVGWLDSRRHDDLQTFLRALRLLIDAGVDVQAMLFSAGDAARRAVRAAALRHCVTVVEDDLGWCETTSGLDALVVSSADEQTHLAPLVALAHGRAIVAASDLTAPWIADADLSLHYARGSPHQLCEQLRRVNRRDEELAALAARGAAYVRDRHAVSAAADAWIAAVHAALGGTHAEAGA